VTDVGDGVQRLAMLAAAVAGRPVAIGLTERGQPAWTDGATVYLDPSASPREQVQALAVQSSLLATGGLAPEVVRRLTSRRGDLAARYLAVEGHRALAANEGILPAIARELIDHPLADRTSCPTDSLELAASAAMIAIAPPSFGTIRARKLLAAQRVATDQTSPGRHAPRSSTDRELVELEDDADDVDGAATVDPFSSPVGGAVASASCLGS
jgi:nitric oxide reductase NorD protein